MSTISIRDDNLRLIFAEPAKADIAERMQAIKGGAGVMTLLVLATVLQWVAAATGGPASGVLALFLWVFSVVAIASPIIYAILAVEYRRAKRDEAELTALLKRYNRV